MKSSEYKDPIIQAFISQDKHYYKTDISKKPDALNGEVSNGNTYALIEMARNLDNQAEYSREGQEKKELRDLAYKYLYLAEEKGGAKEGYAIGSIVPQKEHKLHFYLSSISKARANNDKNNILYSKESFHSLMDMWLKDKCKGAYLEDKAKDVYEAVYSVMIDLAKQNLQDEFFDNGDYRVFADFAYYHIDEFCSLCIKDDWSTVYSILSQDEDRSEGRYMIYFDHSQSWVKMNIRPRVNSHDIITRIQSQIVDKILTDEIVNGISYKEAKKAIENQYHPSYMQGIDRLVEERRHEIEGAAQASCTEISRIALDKTRTLLAEIISRCPDINKWASKNAENHSLNLDELALLKKIISDLKSMPDSSQKQTEEQSEETALQKAIRKDPYIKSLCLQLQAFYTVGKALGHEFAPSEDSVDLSVITPGEGAVILQPASLTPDGGAALLPPVSLESDQPGSPAAEAAELAAASLEKSDGPEPGAPDVKPVNPQMKKLLLVKNAIEAADKEINTEPSTTKSNSTLWSKFCNKIAHIFSALNLPGAALSYYKYGTTDRSPQKQAKTHAARLFKQALNDKVSKTAHLLDQVAEKNSRRR